MPIRRDNGVSVKSIQKFVGTIPIQSWPTGATTKTRTMPNFPDVDPDSCVVQNGWWFGQSGTVNQPISVFFEVTGPDEITIVVNNPGALFTAALRVGCTVVEYR